MTSSRGRGQLIGTRNTESEYGGKTQLLHANSTEVCSKSELFSMRYSFSRILVKNVLIRRLLRTSTNHSSQLQLTDTIASELLEALAVEVYAQLLPLGSGY